MRRSSSSVVTTASTVLASTPTSAPGGSVFTSGGITTNVGKVASALLAKHVRTLEVLHSLQLDNAKLRQDIQGKQCEEDIQRRITDTVAEAVAGANDSAEKLRVQVERLRQHVGQLEGELTCTKDASAKALSSAGCQMETLRVEIRKLQEQCATLEFDAGHHAREALCRAETEAQKQQLSAKLVIAEGRASDLANKLLEHESILTTLKTKLKERHEVIRAMESREASIKSLTTESEARVFKMQQHMRELREKIDPVESERDLLKVELEGAIVQGDTLRAEVVDRTSTAQTLTSTIEELTARAIAAETRLSEERQRSRKLGEDGVRKLEEQGRMYNEALTGYAREREELVTRITLLSHELENLRLKMNHAGSQFSKYVEAKTENNQLKEELDDLRERIVAPRPPHRRHSAAVNSSGRGYTTAALSSVTTLGGGKGSKHAIVERMRASLSVARGRSNSVGNGSNGLGDSVRSDFRGVGGSGNRSRGGAGELRDSSIERRGTVVAALSTYPSNIPSRAEQHSQQQPQQPPQQQPRQKPQQEAFKDGAISRSSSDISAGAMSGGGADTKTTNTTEATLAGAVIVVGRGNKSSGVSTSVGGGWTSGDGGVSVGTSVAGRHAPASTRATTFIPGNLGGNRSSCNANNRVSGGDPALGSGRQRGGRRTQQLF